MYTPNFCLECGTKLLRLRWHIWTSRRFCNKCARRLWKVRVLPPLVATFALLGSGYLTGRMQRAPAPPLTIERRFDSPLNDKESPALKLGSESGVKPTEGAVPATPLAEEVYLCGARTKKGTPCSRRVHGPVRCWQHQGRPAMLPQQRLLIKDLAPTKTTL
jgi:hypothetical protein